MDIGRRILILLFNILLFVLLWGLYAPHHDIWRKAATWGTATPEVRAAVLRQLEFFQEAYTRRDVKQLPMFMERVFSRQRPIVLGTMPGEIYVDYDGASDVVRKDWESWGDCRFRVNEAEVSAVGDVAWFAMAGNVKFDLSRFLVLPLRLSGVMVNENGSWRIRQAQFQFDLDLNSLLVAQILLATWIIINFLLVAVAVYRHAVGLRTNKTPALLHSASGKLD